MLPLPVYTFVFEATDLPCTVSSIGSPESPEMTTVAIDPRVDPRTRMVGVRAAVPNDEGRLHPGMPHAFVS